MDEAIAIATAVRSGERRASEVIAASIAAIDRWQPHTHAWLVRCDEAARAHAARIDEARAAGRPLGSLCGVALGLKDLFVTRGVETTAGSRVLQGWVPPYEGTHARRLASADAPLLGKLALDEFAMGSSSENVPGEAVRNPWALDRIAGGSSGGSAVAVATGMCTVALGTDTGGS